MVEITNEASAQAWQAWLGGKPQEVRVAFAARCALRALPGIASDSPETLSGLAFPIQRAILTSAVAAVGSTADVKEAASAASAARSADSPPPPSPPPAPPTPPPRLLRRPLRYFVRCRLAGT